MEAGRKDMMEMYNKQVPKLIKLFSSSVMQWKNNLECCALPGLFSQAAAY
jgi:hypothetical protein